MVLFVTLTVPAVFCAHACHALQVTTKLERVTGLKGN